MPLFWGRGWINNKGTHANNFEAGQDLLQYTLVVETAVGSNIVIEAPNQNDAIGFVISSKGAILGSRVDVILFEEFHLDEPGSGSGELITDFVFDSLTNLLTLTGSTSGDWIVDLSSLIAPQLIGQTSGNITNPAPIGANHETYLGENAGNGITALNATCIGYNAGSGSTAVVTNLIAIGNGAGSLVTAAGQSNGLIAIGSQAGNGASNPYRSQFFGPAAGSLSIGCNDSVFNLNAAGELASGANDSWLTGFNAGRLSQGLSNTFVWGFHSCENDIVVDPDWNIILGPQTHTGGFVRSVLLGGSMIGNVTNTRDDQFMLADSIINVRWGGIEYVFPPAQGGAATVLTNDGSGNLSWGAGGGPGFITSVTDTSTIDLTVTGTDLTADVINSSITYAKIQNSSAGLTVIGRSANSSGIFAEIVALPASDAVLRESGSVLGFGQIATGGIADDAVTYAKIQNVTDKHLLGRSAGSSGDIMEITIGAGLDLTAGALSTTITQYTDEMAQDAVGTILTDTATIDFTYNDIANTITADVIDDSITFAKIQNITTARLLGRNSPGTGDTEEITLGTGLSFSGTTLNATSAPVVFADNVFRIQDNGDATKQLAWEVSGITTGTTRTITALNISGTDVLSNGALTNTRIPFWSSSGLVDDADLTFVTDTLTATIYAVTTRIEPVSNDGAPLGSTTKQFSDLFLAEGGVINWDNGDATLTQVGDVVTLAGADLKITTPGNASTSVLTTDGTQTQTNKRITKRTGTTASSATPTINTDNVDFYSITALAANITSFTTNLSGTPTEAQTLWIAITDNGTARTLAWGASFEASGSVALPTTTVISTRLDVGFVWNIVTSKWRCVAVA